MQNVMMPAHCIQLIGGFGIPPAIGAFKQSHGRCTDLPGTASGTEKSGKSAQMRTRRAHGDSLTENDFKPRKPEFQTKTARLAVATAGAKKLQFAYSAGFRQQLDGTAIHQRGYS